MDTFYNFTLKIETSWAKKVVKSILETWNVNDAIVYVWFIYFWKKKLNKCYVKKNNLNAQNLQKKPKKIQIKSKIKST